MARTLARILLHPSLWTTALRLGWRLGLRPDPAYMKFRMITMYGDTDAHTQTDDLIAYLRWCRSWERATG